MAFIRTRCMIELALDRAVLRLKAMDVEREPVVVRSRYIDNKQRARSMH